MTALREESVMEEVAEKTAVVTEGGREEEVVEISGFDQNVGMLEEILGYKFQDASLVREALTHVSIYQRVKQEVTYERLEFVGDGVLNCLIAREVFCSHRDLPPGPLTRLRAANVDTEKLARVTVQHGLHCYLRHKATKLEAQIENFTKAILDYPNHSNGLLDLPKALANIVESLLGAVFMDNNSCLETVWKVIKRLFELLITIETLGMHPVSELHELCQKKGMRLRFIKDTWTENTMLEVFVDDNLVGSSTYEHKKEIAQNRAAKATLENLKKLVVTD